MPKVKIDFRHMTFVDDIRYRRHVSAPKSNKLEVQTDKLEEVFVTHEQKFGPLKKDIFKSVFIPPEVLKQSLSPVNEIPKGNGTVRDEMIKCRRRKKIAFSHVVESAQEFLKKRKEEKKKAKKDILGNFQSLTDALPDLKELMEKKAKEDAKPRAAKHFSKQDAEMMEDLLTYQHVLNNPEYTADPLGTLTDQLRQRLQSGSL